MVNQKVSRDTRSFRADLYASLPETLVALLLSAIIFAIIAARVHSGIDAAAIEMPSMMGNGGVWPYSMSQAVGWAAFLLSWATILFGVLLPILSRSGQTPFRRTLEQLHRCLSLALIGFILIHALLLLQDRMGDTLVTIFVPWTTQYKPGRLPVTVGICSLYLAILLGASFYFRNTLGVRAWLLLHRYVIPAVYVLALWHTFLYGSDVKVGSPLGIVLWVIQIPILFAFVVRITGSGFRKYNRRARTRS